MRTIVPPHVVDYHRSNFGGGWVFAGRPLLATMADGSEVESPRFFFDFVFVVLADPSTGRAGAEVRTGPSNRGPDAPACLELPLRTGVRMPAPRARSSSKNMPPIVIGMDLLHRWRLVMDGPRRSNVLTISS